MPGSACCASTCEARARRGRPAVANTMPVAARISGRLLANLPVELTRDGVQAVGLFAGRRDAAQISGRGGRCRAVARGGATVCAPIDLSATCRRMMRPRNVIYHRAYPRHDEGRGNGGRRGDHRCGESRPSWGRAPSGTTTRSSSRRATALPARRITTSAASPFASWAASACRPWCWGRWTIPGFPARSSGYDWAGNEALTPLLPAQRWPCRLPWHRQPPALERRWPS